MNNIHCCREDDGFKEIQQNNDIHITMYKKPHYVYEIPHIQNGHIQKLYCGPCPNSSSQALIQTGLPEQETGWVFCVRSEGREPESEHSSFSPSILGSRGSTGCRVCWIRRLLAVECRDLSFYLGSVITKPGGAKSPRGHQVKIVASICSNKSRIGRDRWK